MSYIYLDTTQLKINKHGRNNKDQSVTLLSHIKRLYILIPRLHTNLTSSPTATTLRYGLVTNIGAYIDAYNSLHLYPLLPSLPHEAFQYSYHDLNSNVYRL